MTIPAPTNYTFYQGTLSKDHLITSTVYEETDVAVKLTTDEGWWLDITSHIIVNGPINSMARFRVTIDNILLGEFAIACDSHQNQIYTSKFVSPHLTKGEHIVMLEARVTDEECTLLSGSGIQVGKVGICLDTKSEDLDEEYTFDPAPSKDANLTRNDAPWKIK
jgi:hypothetical protein